MLQGIETYKDRHIVYSLGNFVFGANSQPDDMDSLILQEHFHLDASRSRVARVSQTLVPVRISSDAAINDFRPLVLQGTERERVLSKVADLTTGLQRLGS